MTFFVICSFSPFAIGLSVNVKVTMVTSNGKKITIRRKGNMLNLHNPQ